MIDLRSDTVTQPTQAMRDYLAVAPVGDAGYGDDPSVNALQALAAEMTGKEAALFFPSGIMANLCALLTLGYPGSSVALGARAHIYQYEAGGLATFAGLTPKLFDDSTGVPPQGALRALSRPVDVHFPPLAVMALENTHNDCGGTACEPDTFALAVRQGKELGLAIHLDGARLANAAVLHHCSLADYAEEVDTVQICLSKGLGAPMGSVLCARRDLLEKAAFHRKRLGGELRQAGLMAAAGIFALTNHFDRLAEDHRRAADLAAGLKAIGFSVEEVANATNMTYFTLPEGTVCDEEFGRRCLEQGLQFNFAGPRRVRLVTHLGISDDDVEKALKVMGASAA